MEQIHHPRPSTGSDEKSPDWLNSEMGKLKKEVDSASEVLEELKVDVSSEFNDAAITFGNSGRSLSVPKTTSKIFLTKLDFK